LVYQPKEEENLQAVNGREVLGMMKQLCKGNDKPNNELWAKFEYETKRGKLMSKYEELASEAVSALIDAKQESDMRSFLSGDLNTFIGNEAKGMNDFELVCYLDIR
jgi:hypothetical protein